MDLSEVRASHTQRHPWETARAEAIERILKGHGARPRSILDVGCGDGFTGERLSDHFGSELMWGVDVHLSQSACEERSRGGRNYGRELSAVGEQRFGLGLLCDVIEHVEDDRGLVEAVLSRLEDDGRLLITVPSFQSLFSSHDTALRHFRRYSFAQLERVVVDAGGEVLDGGYLFGSLLPVRALQKVAELVAPPTPREEFGVGGWNGAPWITRGMELAFGLDNRFLLALNARRFKVPGLSAWVLCKKRP